MNWMGTYARRAIPLRPSAIRATAIYAAQDGAISFASGSPNPTLFPHEVVARVAAALMSDPSRRAQALQYGASEGYGPLRELIAGRAGVTAAEVLLTSGSQQALDLVGKLFLDPGDRAIVTDPTYLGALQAFNLFQPSYVSVATEASSGIDLAALEQAFRRGAKFLYVMPDFANPSGVTLPLTQRRALLDMSGSFGIPIVEDQAYAELWFGPEKLPSLLALSREADKGHVIHLGTFSKSVAPGLRVGWMVAPQPVAEKLALLKQASDLQSGLLDQMIVHGVATTAFETHTAALRQAYRRRRDTMLRALANHMPQSVRWNEPDGGMFVWVTLPTPLDATAVQRRAADQEKVVIVPGVSFFANGGGAGTLRLSFSLIDERQIETGIERLARVIRSALNEAAAGAA